MRFSRRYRSYHSYRSYCCATALVSALICLAACGGTDRKVESSTNTVGSTGTAKHQNEFVGVLRAPDKVPFEYSWDLQLPGPVTSSWIGNDINNVLFVQVKPTNAIYAIDAFSGKTKWISQPLPKPIAGPAQVSRLVLPSGEVGSTINDDRLYAVSDDVMYCIDGAYGEVVWNMKLPFSAASGPTAVGNEGSLRIFLGDWAGRIQVLTWTPKNNLSYVAWQYLLSAPVTAPAAAYENLVYVGDHGGKVTCFDFERDVKWQTKLGGKVMGSADPINRLLFVGATDNIFYCLNRLSGQELTRAHLNAPITRAPFHFNVDPGLVYVWTDHADPGRGGLWCFEARGDQLELTHNLDAQNRPRKKEIIRMSQRFFVPGVTKLVSSSPEYLYLMRDNSSVVQAVNRTTGGTDWAWDLNAGHGEKAAKVAQVTEFIDPQDYSRSLFTVDSNNKLVAYRLYGGRDVSTAASR